tara:strand:+ start:1142 stop:1789 length:648 start_codon:yes stop_codon:yes gene_type:complete
MNYYVIQVSDIPQSVQAAKRCIQSGQRHGVSIKKFDAVTPRNCDIYRIARINGIDTEGFKEVYSRFENCLAAFLSHFQLWKISVEHQETLTIFEHDAVIVNQLNSDIPFDKVMTLGKPSYGQYRTPNFLGTGPLTQKAYFKGAHAYSVKPAGAEELIKQARIKARPTDVFLNIHTFPWLQENYPWKVEVKESFTTIQNTKGCLAKHGYGESYEIL